MATNISLKLDCKKIEKKRLYRGEKGIYLDATIIMWDEPDKYGNNGMIVQNVNDEDRKAGIKGAILGNVRYLVKRDQPQQPVQDDDDGLPF
jgi:hypothetical protein